MDELWPVLKWIIAVAVSGTAVVLVLLAVNLGITRLGRRTPTVLQSWLRVRRPLAALLLAISLRIAFAATAEASTFRDVGLHVLLIAIIVAAVWFIATLVLAWLDHTQRRVVARKSDDDRGRRRAQTQMVLVRRVVNAVFVIIGAALVLLTFPGVERVGATILASAGLLSVVAGIAAQSSLSNLFAGLQLAFTDAIRIGDIVEVDGTWSTIEDITLSYVVLSIWDERHKVLPSTYFTTEPFINWSRTGDTVTGVVYFELDWRTDFAGMRAELTRFVSEHPAWDGRAQSVVVTDAVGGHVTVRALVTTKNADNDWVLRCAVREHLIVWLREHNPEALPVRRVSMPPYAEQVAAAED
ncbi:mechanosensitive ion channel family protein [Georgenia sp. H159]|uniref:mechanosensitive ion channel family protein n=1 Tax=Georgenia sp. H159 TaxID=3076115 RepID=UPI002D794AA0|nr:mechanosensitive ion channel domain-containing protein [Georgenia sp. H159]